MVQRYYHYEGQSGCHIYRNKELITLECPLNLAAIWLVTKRVKHLTWELGETFDYLATSRLDGDLVFAHDQSKEDEGDKLTSVSLQHNKFGVEKL